MNASHLPLSTDLRPLGRERATVGAAVRAVALGAAVTVATVIGTLVVGADTASAVSAPMASNAMAPIVTTSAREALDSYEQWVASDDMVAYRSFVWFRTQTARYAASELGYPQNDMVEAWAASPVGHQLAVLAAMTQIGVPYRTNTSQEGVGFDCSGLTTFAWSRAGIQLTRQSSAQIREAAPVERANAKAGDLVQYPGHVMMYLGVGDAVIHSVMSGRTVELDTINARRTNSVRFGDPTA